METNFKIYYDNSANIDIKIMFFKDHIKRYEVAIEYLKVEFMIVDPVINKLPPK